MADENKEKPAKESRLVATVITNLGNPKITTLITPDAKYILCNGELRTVPIKVTDYNTDVQDEINTITKRAQTPMINMLNQEEYLIQIYGDGPEVKLS